MLTLVIAAPAAAQAPPPAPDVNLEGFATVLPVACPADGDPITYTYSASGTSSGSYPGTFTATGTIGWDGQPTTDTLELQDATFTIQSEAGLVEGRMSLSEPTLDGPVYCGEGGISFVSPWAIEWHGTITAFDGSRWGFGAGSAPDLFYWGEGLWAYREWIEAEEPWLLAPPEPATREDCADGGYQRFGFEHLGACVAHVEAGPRTPDGHGP
jgi:hypothetical protein